jgi:hypothetical protein
MLGYFMITEPSSMSLEVILAHVCVVFTRIRQSSWEIKERKVFVIRNKLRVK